MNAVRGEVKDMSAFKLIYKKYSLDNAMNQKPILPTIQSREEPSDVPNHDQIRSSSEPVHDPFRVRKSLIDIGIEEISAAKHKKTKKLSPEHQLKNLRRQVDSIRLGQTSETYKSVMPGNCTSFFTLR